MIDCKICSNPAQQVINFGQMPIANNFISPEDFPNEFFFELCAAYCPSCSMFQLVEQPDPEKMFHKEYAFFSSTSKAMAQHFEQMANNFMTHFLPSSTDAFVIELGSNDGIMLKHFAAKQIRHLGVEPSANVAEIAKKQGINTVCKFFGEQAAKDLINSHGPADIISAANVMCHIPDLHSVARGVNLLLKEKGFFVFEEPYLAEMIQKNSYDQIYDEHVYIFSVQSVINTFAYHGLELIHVEPQKTHGGSMRYYLCRAGAHPQRHSVHKQLEFEKFLGLDKLETYHCFKDRCEKNKKDLVHLLTELKEQGKRVVGYAATSKSTTILNYCQINADLIEYICDTTPLKQGKYSPGVHIPIKSYEKFKQDKPDYVVLFAWNHAQEIFDKESESLAHGGRWIVFVPTVKILQHQEKASHNVH